MAEDYNTKLKQAWEAGGQSSSIGELQHKMSNLSSDFARWGRQSVGSIQGEIRSLQRELENLRTAPDRLDPSPREVEVVTNLTGLLEQEEMMWRQRSRLQWLAAGDKNTRFFHLRASQRRKKNRIAELTRCDGMVETRERELG
jgi:hypothetical protein